MVSWVSRASLVVLVSVGLAGCDADEGGDGPNADGSSSGADDGGSDPSGNDAGGSSDGGDAGGTDGSGSDSAGSGNDSGGDDSGSDDSGGNDDGNLNCCEEHSAAGCNEPTVEQCVCDRDATCCVFGWDVNCAQMAEQSCQAECVDGPKTEVPECEDTAFQVTPADAIYTGDWGTTMSQSGEGTVAFVGQNGSLGSVTYGFEVPCADTWYVWVRYFDIGEEDAYFVRVDGFPDPSSAVFEGDCTSDGGGYGWRLLNWRDPGDPSCQYLEDPWSFEWDAGEHAVEFSFLEARALGRVVITNVEDFDPADQLP